MLLTLLFLFLFTRSEAQQFYPVQVRSYVQSPSVFIEDYKDPNNFRVQVTLTDLTVPSLDVILNVTFNGPSIKFESTTGIPLHLIGGVTYSLDREDLENLLSPVNLPGAPTTLPEGAYVISFKSIERNSNTPVSNALTDFTSVVVMLNDPPLLTSPGKGELLDLVASGQNFMFSWTPRSFSLNPQQQVKYRLTMALIPPDRNPYDAFLTNAFNINETFEDIQYNSFFYDQSMLALTPGATYAWQVQAYEEMLINGVPKKISQRFRNEGKSDVFVFKVKESCPPLFLKTPELKPNPETNKQEILLAWNKDPGHQLYEVKYKIQGSVLPWTILQLPQEAESLTLGEQQLQKGQTYEYYVSCRCTGWQEAIYGGTFILPASECEAPFPILVSSNDEKGIALSWTKVASANAYNVYYTDNNTKITSVKENITDGSVLLPALTSGSYTIHIDAVCGTSTAVGENLELKFDEKDFPGSCPVPSPFTFLAKRPGGGTDPLAAQLTWPKLDLHESFKLTYWHKDAPIDKHTQTLLTPEVLVNGIKNNEFYNYTIEFICKGGKTATTPQGGFRLEGGELDTPLDPPTADCFPPAVHSAEPKNETTARIDWKGISGAEEYVVVYKPKDGSGQEKIFTTTAANAKLTGLTPGLIYQYKIRCKCGGKFSINSEPGEFDLSKSEKGNKDCDSISNLKIKQITETEIQLSWPYPQLVKPGNKTQTSYTIRYKENGQVWGENYPISLVLTSELQDDYGTQGEVKKTINMLSSGVRYDIEVKAYCGTDDAIANEPLSGTTKEMKEADCSQGGSCDRTSKRPLEGLKIGDTIGVSDYKMKIITLSPDTRGTNLWKGTGVAATPLIGKTDNVRFNIDFDSLYVNDKVCVTGGNLKAGIGAQLFDDKTTAKIKGLVDDFGTALNDAQKASKDAAKLIDDAQKAGEDAFNYFQGGDDVGFVKTGSLGGISTEASNFNDLEVEGNSIKVGGKSYPVDRFPTLVKDKNGNVVSVSSNGTKTEVGHYDESLKGLQNAPTSSSAKVIFKANSNAIYSFDAWQDGYGKSVAMAPHYLNIDGKYYSAKAITPGAVDKVDFDFSRGDKSKLKFVNREGFVFKTLSGSTLQLAGGPAKDGQEILAIYDNGSKKEIAGALLLASYPIVEKKVKLVTLAMGDNFNKDINAIQAQLNKAYNPIGINYTIEVDNSFDQNKDWCEGKNCDDFKTGGSGLLNNDYTGVEARVIDAYINFKGEDKLEATTAYMFVIGMSKAEQGDEALQGKMNFSKQFGFLYSAASQNPQTLGRTLAHELGHGNYKLYHIFDPMYLGNGARNSDNLMSYNTNVNALALNKLQWDVAHDPGVTWGVFKRDGDQELADQRKSIEFIRLLRISNIYGAIQIPMNSDNGFPLDERGSIRIGKNTYHGLKIETGKSGPIQMSNNIIQGLNVKITLKDNSEAASMLSFLNGAEKDIYGDDKSEVTVVTSDGISTKVSLKVIANTMEQHWVTLLRNKRYFILSDEEKLILDIPIMMWNLGLRYGAIFMHNWFLGTGNHIHFTDNNKKELLDASVIYTNFLQKAIDEINSGAGYYEGNYTSTQLMKIKNLILDPKNKNQRIAVDIIPDYTSNSDQYNCFKFYPVSTLSQADLLSNNINDDLIASFGSYTLNIVFSGFLNIKGYDYGYAEIDQVKYRIYDSFDFNDGSSWSSQNLGYWQYLPYDKAAFPSKYWFSSGFLIENSDFIGLYNAINMSSNSGRTPWDFYIITKYYLLETNLDNIDYSVDFFKKVTISPKLNK
ncbi:MAG: fibronectin type III domain-containing protein [Sporocytophaga sp.]|nr:fibronectin type III domain-containing protein [Sporocytophaga sp.]